MKYILYRLNEEFYCDSSLVIIDSDIKDIDLINKFINEFFCEYRLAFSVDNYNLIDLDVVDVYVVEEKSFLTYLNLLEEYNNKISKLNADKYKFIKSELNEKSRLETLIKEEIETLDSKIYKRIPVGEFSGYSDSEKSKILENGYEQISSKGGNIRFVSKDKDLIELKSKEKIDSLKLVISELNLKIKEKSRLFHDLNIKPTKPDFQLEIVVCYK